MQADRCAKICLLFARQLPPSARLIWIETRFTSKRCYFPIFSAKTAEEAASEWGSWGDFIRGLAATKTASERAEQTDILHQLKEAVTSLD